MFNLIQNAGGRFVLLFQALPDARKVAALQAELDGWLGERYLGELALNLALSPPFDGNGLQANQFSKVQTQLNRALDSAKQQALRHYRNGILPISYEQDECTACGKAPARHRDGDARRCDVSPRRTPRGWLAAQRWARLVGKLRNHGLATDSGAAGQLWLTLRMKHHVPPRDC